MRIIILIVGAIVYYAILIILAKMFIKTFQFKRTLPWMIGILVVGIIPLFCVLDYSFRGIHFFEMFSIVGYLLLGFFIYYIICLAIILIAKSLYRCFRKQVNGSFNKASIILASIASIVICVIGIISAQIPEYTYRKIDIGAKEHLKLVVVSDIHYGATGSLLSLSKMVDHVNQTNADVILLTGDVFDNKVKNLDQNYFRDSMNALQSKYGVYAITGNHEFMQNNLDEIKDFYTGTQVHLLLDEAVTINHIQIIGRQDYRGGRKKLEEISTEKLPTIVLDHQPQFYRDAEEFGADLQISGHTHNGQIFPADVLIALLNLMAFQSPSNGIHTYDDFTLAITRGYGTWGFPMRLTGPSQILILEV